VASVPITVTLLPSSLTPWSGMIVEQLQKWNFYADIFRWRDGPTTTFLPQDWNGSFDIVGFLSPAEYKRRFWHNFDDLPSNALAVCVRRMWQRPLDRDYTIEEADLVFNSEFQWTLNDEAVYNGGGGQSFRTTLMHELGHMFGLDHEGRTLSLMNYPSPGNYDAFSFPFADDAAGIRAAYPNQAQRRTDLAVHLFWHAGGGLGGEDGDEPVNQAWKDASVSVSGNRIRITNFTVENVGSTRIDRPTIEWYLTLSRSYDTRTAHYLGTTAFSPGLNAGGRYNPRTASVSFVVPAGVETGDYYVFAFVRNDESPSQGASSIGNDNVPSGSSFPFSNNHSWTWARKRIIGTAGRPATLTVKSASGEGAVNLYRNTLLDFDVRIPDSEWGKGGQITVAFFEQNPDGPRKPLYRDRSRTNPMQHATVHPMTRNPQEFKVNIRDSEANIGSITFFAQYTRTLNGVRTVMPISDGYKISVGPDSRTVLHVSPLSIRKNKELKFEVDMARYINRGQGNTEVIFYMAQPPLPTEVSDREFDQLLGSDRAPEIGRVTSGDGYAVWTKNLRDTAANLGEAAFYTRVGNPSQGSEIAYSPQGGIKTGVRVNVEPADPGSVTALYVFPGEAKLELTPGSPKGTELTFEVDMANYRGQSTEVIFYYVQPPPHPSLDFADLDKQDRLRNIGRVTTSAGYVIWTKQIRETALNRGEAAFYALVGSEWTAPGAERNVPKIHGSRVYVK
jgi:hypothetical protein